ncbi:hypothetical protein EVC16_118 [Rhizobium phage RHph_Y21]|nr:hypothetical protein EVC16_118 [Rhizobium phage RHph_Y21]
MTLKRFLYGVCFVVMVFNAWQLHTVLKAEEQRLAWDARR